MYFLPDVTHIISDDDLNLSPDEMEIFPEVKNEILQELHGALLAENENDKTDESNGQNRESVNVTGKKI